MYNGGIPTKGKRMNSTEQDQIDKGYNEYERKEELYRHALEKAWPNTLEGKAAISDMISDNAHHVARAISIPEWKYAVSSLVMAKDRMIDRAVGDILANASEEVILSMIDTPAISDDDLLETDIAFSEVK